MIRVLVSLAASFLFLAGQAEGAERYFQTVGQLMKGVPPIMLQLNKMEIVEGYQSWFWKNGILQKLDFVRSTTKAVGTRVQVEEADDKYVLPTRTLMMTAQARRRPSTHELAAADVLRKRLRLRHYLSTESIPEENVCYR